MCHLLLGKVDAAEESLGLSKNSRHAADSAVRQFIQVRCHSMLSHTVVLPPAKSCGPQTGRLVMCVKIHLVCLLYKCGELAGSQLRCKGDMPVYGGKVDFGHIQWPLRSKR